jgi:hypothetical protein
MPKQYTLDQLPTAYRLDDLARQGPVGRTTLTMLIKDGALPAKKIGRTTFVLRRDWESFLESCRSGPDRSVVAALRKRGRPKHGHQLQEPAS